MPNAVFVRRPVTNICQMLSLFAARSRSFPFVVRRQILHAAVVQCHRHPSPSPSVEVVVSCRSHRCQSAIFAVSVAVSCSCHCSLLSAAAFLPIYCLLPPLLPLLPPLPPPLPPSPPSPSLPPPPPFFVGGRHHCHLLSAVAVPLVASAIAHQLQSLISATITSKHPDER